MRLVHEAQLLEHLGRQHERIRILHAHAAIEAVERQRHRVPARGQRFEIAKRQRIGGHVFAGTLGAGNAQRKSVALGGLERVDHVQVMRPGFRPVLPGMHGGVGADERIRPVRGRALLVVALHRLVVVERVVAEELAKCAEQVAVPDQPVPVVVADLMPQVAEHGAIGLAHLLAHVFAKRRVGLGDVERDDAFIVAGHHGLVIGAAQEMERHSLVRPFLPRGERQLQ